MRTHSEGKRRMIAYIKRVRFTDPTKRSPESAQVQLTIETDKPSGLTAAQTVAELVGRWVEVEL